MSLNDVSRAFRGWLSEVTGTRSSGTYVNGRWVVGTNQPISFNGVIQNATPDDMKVLEEGQRAEEGIKIHTTFELIPQVADTTTGDIIPYKGKNWLVYNVAHRFIGNYHKAIAVRQ